MGKKTYLYDSFAQIKFKSKGGKVVFKIIRRLNREQATNLRYLGLKLWPYNQKKQYWKNFEYTAVYLRAIENSLAAI